MPNLSALEVKMSSGQAGTTFQTVDRVQSASYGLTLEKSINRALGRFKPLEGQPKTNFTPVQLNVSFIKASKEIETNFGLVNSTGVGIVFGGTDGLTVAGYGARNFQLLHAPSQSNNYNGETDLWSGVLTSYNITASVGQPVQGSFSVEAVDFTNPGNTAGRNTVSYATSAIIPENVRISGIDLSGVGFAGISIQNFSLGLSFSRQSAIALGSRIPSRIISDVNATISIDGYFEGALSSFSGARQFNCGQAYTGSFWMTLVPACGDGEATTYIIRNPYVDSLQVGAQVGNFTSLSLQFNCPISVNSGEAVSGSNVIIL